MKINQLFLAILFILGFQSSLHSQSTADLFSQEGLSVNAYHYNMFDGTYSKSFTFLERIPGEEGIDTIWFVGNQSGNEIFLVIDNERVFFNNGLIYDFGVQVGDVIETGLYTDFEVIQVEMMLLLNEEFHKAISITKDGLEVTYVEGIGDIQRGLTPSFAGFEGEDVLVCAKITDELLLQNPSSNDAECELYSCVWPRPEFELLIEDFILETINTSSFGDEFLWDFGDGETSSFENPMHVYEDPGCYTITLNISNDCYQGSRSNFISTSVCTNSAWEHEYTNDSIRFSLYAYDANTDFVYSDTSLFRVTNQGNTWEELSNTPTGGVAEKIQIVRMWDEDKGLAGCKSGVGLMVTSDGGQTWNSTVEDAYWISNMVLEESGKAFVQRSIYVKYFYRTLDFGETWETLEIDPTGYKFSSFLLATENRVYARAFFEDWSDDPEILLGVSEDNGATWDFLELPPDCKRIQFVDDLNGFCHDEDVVWHTEDGGLNWNQIPNLSDIGSIFFNSATHGWVKENTGGVLYSTDGFETYAFTECGYEPFNEIQPLSDSSAVAYISSNQTGTRKYSFDSDLIGDCNAPEAPSSNVQMKIFLEGNYDASTGEMHQLLYQLGLLPEEHPFSSSPWNSTATVATFNPPSNTVDWVLVEAYTGTAQITGNPGLSLVESQVGLLLQNGEIVAPDGSIGLDFLTLTPGSSYHFIVRHRNHLDVLTANPLTADPTIVYDFTSSDSQAFGASQVKQMADGNYALLVGDYLADGIIQITDYDSWAINSAVVNSYLMIDGNLDGIVQVTDYDVWVFNKAKIGVLEVRY